MGQPPSPQERSPMRAPGSRSSGSRRPHSLPPVPSAISPSSAPTVDNSVIVVVSGRCVSPRSRPQPLDRLVSNLSSGARPAALPPTLPPALEVPPTAGCLASAKDGAAMPSSRRQRSLPPMTSAPVTSSPASRLGCYRQQGSAVVGGNICQLAGPSHTIQTSSLVKSGLVHMFPTPQRLAPLPSRTSTAGDATSATIVVCDAVAAATAGSDDAPSGMPICMRTPSATAYPRPGSGSATSSSSRAAGVGGTRDIGSTGSGGGSVGVGIGGIAMFYSPTGAGNISCTAPPVRQRRCPSAPPPPTSCEQLRSCLLQRNRPPSVGTIGTITPQRISFHGDASLASVHLIDQELPPDARLSQLLRNDELRQGLVDEPAAAMCPVGAQRPPVAPVTPPNQRDAKGLAGPRAAVAAGLMRGGCTPSAPSTPRRPSSQEAQQRQQQHQQQPRGRLHLCPVAQPPHCNADGACLSQRPQVRQLWAFEAPGFAAGVPATPEVRENSSEIAVRLFASANSEASVPRGTTLATLQTERRATKALQQRPPGNGDSGGPAGGACGTSVVTGTTSAAAGIASKCTFGYQPCGRSWDCNRGRSRRCAEEASVVAATAASRGSKVYRFPAGKRHPRGRSRGGRVGSPRCRHALLRACRLHRACAA
eukprot:NODE_3004_length_2107_cov_6.589899.p1 GENE.NODE_3004_length_2107_cov_6.589899~~NODE_3004_length_2107_cov_6.589899.p1  ORF type:complete len:648 (-),score=39.41 NODE_3004_length_2107_cov_6.589899:162-2105(-)